MKIKLIFHLVAVVLLVDFSLAKNEIKRRRPIIDTTAQDSEGNYIDQIALDSNPHSSSNVLTAPGNFIPRYHTATDEFRKPFSKKSPSEQKVQYITPEPYDNFSHDYVHHALKTHEKSKEKSLASSFLEYSSHTRDDTKKASTPKRQKLYESEPEDYNYYFPESKKINTRTTSKPALIKDDSEKYYKPQSTGAIITKDVKSNGDDVYHYYYPEESNSNETTFEHSSSTRSPPAFVASTTKAPKPKLQNKKKFPSVQHTSTDSYQYQPVLQRPSEYAPSENPKKDFLESFATHEVKSYVAYGPSSQSTPSPIKMLKPTKRNNFYLPSSSTSPSSTPKPMKIRRPSTESPYADLKQFSVSPSPSTTSHFSTTRAPELYKKYSTRFPVSSSNFEEFYMKPSSQPTPSATTSTNDFGSDNTQGRTVVIKPKTNYQNHGTFEPIKEQIIYKFVPEETYVYEPNKTGYYSTSATFPEPVPSGDYFQAFNKSLQGGPDFFNDFQKNYNYEYFTEQDAGRMEEDSDEIMKMDHHSIESDHIEDKQKASKKNMYFPINSQMEEFQQQPIIMHSDHLDDHEMPPPEVDNDAEASKNQYFVLYSVDEEEKKQQKKQKRKPKPVEPDVVYHHHHHQHDQNERGEENQHYDSEFDSEFDSELTNSDNVRIVDPSVRGGRPLEFTKDDYLRHIKQAVVQYMKDYQPKEQTTSTGHDKQKNQRFSESSETPYRPAKASNFKQNLPSSQYKSMTPLKLPKNIYTANRLKDAIDELQESPQVDLTVKKNKQKPIDLSAIDVGQSYQHVSHFDHTAALRNVEEFDQSNVVMHQQTKPKLHFSQQTYHDINNLSLQKQKQQHQQQQHQQQHQDESENESPSSNLYKGYVLPNKYSLKGNQASSYAAMSYDGSKLPRIVSHHGQDDDDEDDNKVEDPVDAPIQIINGIPVANPYNIDLNTLKYMLGGIAQAEVSDQLKDLDGSPSNNHKIPANWKSFSPGQFGSFTSNTNPNPSIYQVYGQQDNSQRLKKNSGQTGNLGANNQQQSKYPLVGNLVNFNKNKHLNNKQKNSNKNNQQNFGIADFSGWNQMSKKHRSEPQTASSNNQFILRPFSKNQHARDERLHQKGSINRARSPPQLSTDMRPPPQIMPKTQLRLKKVL